MDRLFNRLALTMLSTVGAKLSKNLLHHFTTPEEIFKAKSKDLLQVAGVGLKAIQMLKKDLHFKKAEQELKFIEKNNISTCWFEDADYPRRLKYFDTAPILLYYRGENVFSQSRTVAVVGTRKPSHYGKDLTNKLLEGLANYNVTLVSGLAYGIDIQAHKQGLKMGIPNIAVLGHGLHTLYPQAHRKTAKEIIATGCLLTEFSSQANFDKENFPRRNRIIAGLADALIVVESGRKGGSIITAEFANEFNKDVFAFPGKTTDSMSEGCNRLIKQHKANLIESVDDLAYVMRWDEWSKEKQIQRTLFNDLDTFEQNIIHILAAHGDLSMDEIMIKSDRSPSATANDLLQLEFKGLIQSMPGKRFRMIK